MSAETKREQSTATRVADSRSTTRPEIQALRAIAVASVLLYHLWPTRVPGGFVGVDIFFAISGYLIIGHLLREVDRHGSVRLADFWARRARRLLPASLLVLVATGVATIIWVPMVEWKQFFSEIGASALYVQNWLLAANSVNYLAAANSPSPVEHYWSLSVEEQFYIAWPILIILLLALARLTGSGRRRTFIAAGLVILTLASFVYSVWDVAADPAAAYFVTPTRAWEFGAGGILALFSTGAVRARPVLRAIASWVGLAVIAATLARYTPQTPFPGAAALPPVLGALLVIWAGSPSPKWSPAFVMGLRPVQWLGDVSYSLYLWHWPLIVLVPFALREPLSGYSRLAILVASVLLAVVTKRYVEDPVRNGQFLLSRPAWFSLVSLLAATVVVSAGSGAAYLETQASIDRATYLAEHALDGNTACVGAAATVQGAKCPRPFAVTDLTNPEFAENDIGKGVQSVDPCKQLTDKAKVLTCDVGDTRSPREVWALVGDSHAGQYLEALDLYGRSHGIEVVTYLKSWCAGTGATGVSTSGDDSESGVKSCASWGRDVLRRVASNPKISTVVFASYTRTYLSSPSNIYGGPLTAADLVAAWRPLAAAGKTIVALRDIPSAGQEDLPDCVAQHLASYDPCALPRGVATLPENDDPVIAAVNSGKVPSARLVDPTSIFCGPTLCHAVIGGLIAYFGSNHMSATFSRTLAPIIGSEIAAASRG